MIFFAAAAVWFAVITLRTTDHRAGNAYHTLMMAAMAWMSERTPYCVGAAAATISSTVRRSA